MWARFWRRGMRRIVQRPAAMRSEVPACGRQASLRSLREIAQPKPFELATSGLSGEAGWRAKGKTQ
jgi:hypothetical protein